MIGPKHAELLAAALADLLPTASAGDVAFLRCLPSDLLDALIDAPEFVVPKWTVAAVVDQKGNKRITADEAVERREEKGAAQLFLIDASKAGAGLDGIYSAAREILEVDLFAKAYEHARKRLRGKTTVARGIQRRAERLLGRRKRLTPWQVFDFLVTAGSSTIGAACAKLGLWPIQNDSAIEDAELDLSVALSERLLFPQDDLSIGDRVKALLLDDPDGTHALELEQFLRELAGRSPMQAALALVSRPRLWIGSLKPQFSGQSLRELSIISWRSPRGTVARWSGLTDPEEDGAKPRLVLDRTATGKDQGRLEVRWSTKPDNLPKASVEYRVTVVAGNEDLAEQTVVHRDKYPQAVVFSVDHFEDFDSDAKFEAFVRISAVGSDEVGAVQSEEFVLEFGQAADRSTTSSGSIVRTLIEGAINIATQDAFDEAVANGHLPPRASEDKKGFISWRIDGGRSVRVLRPALVRYVEDDWRERKGAVGRWIVRVHSDGSHATPVEFVPIDQGACEAGPWERAADSSRKFAADIGALGLLARVHGARWPIADSYINAWIAALEAGGADLALHGTVEVQAISGQTIGLIITPVHCMRVAWRCVYDQLAAHARYTQALTPVAIQKALKELDGTNFPWVLPGVQGGRAFVFADTLGFHAAAMTLDGDPEPKSAVALMAACIGAGQQIVAPSVGADSATVLAREIRYYLACHPQGGSNSAPLDVLTLQAWRPGDGMTVARAMGSVVQELRSQKSEDDDGVADLCFNLDIFHPQTSSSASGSFLTDIGRRRRSGGGELDPQDRWMTETAQRPGDIVLPRLRWARRSESDEPRPAHLSFAFDVFEARLETRSLSMLPAEARPLHAFGLTKPLERSAELSGDPEWALWSSPRIEGERAPDNRVSTDRLVRLDAALSRATSRFLGGGANDWPVLMTRLPSRSQKWIERLHQHSDWVVTVDRNACFEYFDAPQKLPDVYERFVIDAVPSRADYGALQLVTSTSNLEEVRDLVDEALGEMGLSSSERNSRFLLTQLKALSGRLAIRLANPGGRTGELIALALMHAHCAQSDDPTGAWIDLSQGFLVPVDEIIGSPAVSGSNDSTNDSDGGRRADFIHVRAPATRGPLEFRYIEVKHRLHLKTARQPELLASMGQQTEELRRRWENYYFDPSLQDLERSVRRSQLARILSFYVNRAARHRLSSQAWGRLKREIDLLVLKEDYALGKVDQSDIGYIFCPEHRTGRPERLYASNADEARFWLFGPSLLPDERASIVEATSGPSPEIVSLAPVRAGSDDEGPSAASPVITVEADDQKANNEVVDRTTSPDAESTFTDVLLGQTTNGNEDVTWRVTIKANPHLMLVGLPGMGKTTCLINICSQLARAGIAPIVFSYHDDIDAHLQKRLGDVNFVDYHGIGFNPLRVDASQATAFVDVTGTLRDIFASIFPDLGDLQLEELRQAIKQSYTDVGWGTPGAEAAPTPKFRAFFDILRGKTKPNLGLLARLQELADYGFFDAEAERASLLDEHKPTIVRIHGTTNGMLQNAFASFILYSLYKDMFRRGVQSRIKHAIVFDEAHRAARLKLIAQFGKECRKFGLSLALASQEARDFDPSLYAAIGSYLALRVTEADARTLARMTGSTLDEKRTADRLKSLDRYTALFFGEGRSRPATVRLTS